MEGEVPSLLRKRGGKGMNLENEEHVVVGGEVVIRDAEIRRRPT